MREAAARVQCQNNLKQLGLAAMNYESSYQGLPPASVQPNPTDPSTFPLAYKSQGWGTPLLSYFEQSALDAQYDKNTFFSNTMPAAPANNNQSVSNQHLKVMQCPSVPAPNRLYTARSSFGFPGITNPWTASAADYCPIRGTNLDYLRLAVTPQPTAAQVSQYVGPLVINKTTPLLGVTDGTSNTFLYAEAAGRPQLYRAGRLAAVGPYPGSNSKTANDLGTPTPWQDVYGGGWADPSAANFRLTGSDAAGTPVAGGGTGVVGPCGVNCSNDLGLYAFHTGGANVVLCDGSVRFVRSAISPLQLVAAISAKAGEVATLD